MTETNFDIQKYIKLCTREHLNDIPEMNLH